MIKKIIILIFIFTAVIEARAYSERDSALTLLERINEKFFDLPRLINFYTLDFNYGYAVPSFPSSGFVGDLCAAYSMELKYGFTRFYNVPGDYERFYYASEYAGVSDVSSRLRFAGGDYSGITADNWRFALGYRNGYGYDYHDGSFLILYHSSALLWSIIDFETKAGNSADQALLDKFDETTRFGGSFEAGAMYNVTGDLYLNASLNHSLVYSNHLFGKWFLSSIGELLLQRTIDFIGDDMLALNKSAWPWLNLVLKYGVSYAFYELKKSHPAELFNIGEPFSYNGFSIGVSYIFPD